MAPPLYTCRQTYFQRAYYKLSHISKSNVHVHSTDSSITRATSTRFTQTSRIWANSSFTRSFSLSHPHSFRHSHPSFKKPKQQQESPLNSLKTYQLNILIDGRSPSDAFSVSVKSTDTVSKLKKLIKAAKAPEFNGIVAKRLSLWSASIPTDRKRRIILSALGLKLKKEIKKLDSTVRISDIEAFGSGPPKGTIHTIIVEIPSGEPYDSRKASMVINKDKFKWFPLNDIRDFESIRANPQYVYFDRTGYISKLESFPGNVLLFLRPRRFGKSLFLSTLAHFHGVQHKHNYKALFQFLDVDKDVINKKVISGQYLILAFDFSKVDRSPDLNTAQNNLRDMINSAIENFYQVYAPYLGNKSSVQLIQDKITPDNSVQSLDRCVNLVREALNGVVRTDNPLYGVKGIYLLADEYDAFSNEYLDPDDSRPWNQLRTGPNSLLKGFWATVKGSIGPRSIVKCFITGVSPLSMADHTSGFNIATYVSWRKELSGLCGLTEEDVLAALRLPSVCKSKYEVQKHFKIMKSHYDGYNFAELGKAPHVFNTNACLEYLDSLARGEPIEPRAISNSEVSEPALQILAASPIATSVISDSLKNKILASSTPANHLIPYNELVQSFRLTHLASDIATSKPAWLSYMLHIGGLTFSRKTKNLEVPNLVAAERFGKAVLDRAGLRYEDVSLAYKNIVSTGNISQVLRLYRQTMCKIDVGIDAFKKEEEHHRNSFYHALLGNTLPSLRDIGLEVNVSKPARQGTGRIDMLIHVPSKKRVLLLEWKVIRIDFLEIKDSPSIEKKVEHLSGTFEATDILNLQFGKNDMRRAGQTIKEWILNGFPQRKGHQSGVSPCQQLREYFTSPEITQLKKEQDVTAYLVVVIGNRQILFWEMDNDGTFQKDAQLA